jgi:putative ABC transport system permease protein
MFALFAEMFPQHDDAVPVNANVRNLAREQNSERAIIQLVLVFIYGFVGMLTLIGLTNVISTISTNVRSRSREFAVLRSVGMTQGGIGRMLNLESILCSAKSLIIGLPLGIAASYLIYHAILFSVDFPYAFPWVAVVQSVLAVFVVTWVTMRYSASRLRGGNIVEEIRKETL